MAAADSADYLSMNSIQEAIATNRIGELAAICDTLELQTAAAGLARPPDWPYAIHLLAHLYNNDLSSARFLWKRIPESVKQGDAEVAAAWRIGQAMWRRDCPGTYEALGAHTWSPAVQPVVTALSDRFSQRMFALLGKAYAVIGVGEAAAALGLATAKAIAVTTQRGWTHDPSADMLTAMPLPASPELKTDIRHLQNLTEYVVHLEH